MPQWTGFYKDKTKKSGISSSAPTSPRPTGSPSIRSISRLGSSFSNLSSSSLNGKQHQAAADDELQRDILLVRRALDCFLDSRINEAEEILEPRRDTSMYCSLGYGFILFLKSVMTFEPSDIEKTLDVLRRTIQLASNERKRDGGWLDNIATWVKGNHVQQLKAMTRMHRHAELVYAEAYLLKALLSIVHDESIVSFVREGLNIRTSYNIYCNLEKYIDFVRQEAEAGKDVTCYQLDDHFTSGVALGVGCFNIILSLLPTTVVRVAELMGFTSDREHGLSVLESVGGWDEYNKQRQKSIIIIKNNNNTAALPESQGLDEGLRRQLCDMVLVTYHVILSRMIPLSNVDQDLAEAILDYNLKLYPSGVFFLYFSGRLLASKRKLQEAKNHYLRAIETQQDWKQLQHICYWELGVIAVMQADWQRAYEVFDTLSKESNWSKAVYTYIKALGLYQLAEQEEQDPEKRKQRMDKVVELMKQVNKAKRKIAGKSIPMEKFVSRKSRKFISQDNYLLMPDLEILNAFTAFDFMPVELLQQKMDRVNAEIAQLRNSKPTDRHHYYDDLCLAYYLRALVARMILQQQQQEDESTAKLYEIHTNAIQTVLENANKVELDHYVYYYARYEKAHMKMNQGDLAGAEAEIQVILHAAEKGQYGVGAGPHAKNKYSLENNLVFKCHNAIEKIRSSKDESIDDDID